MAEVDEVRSRTHCFTANPISKWTTAAGTHVEALVDRLSGAPDGSFLCSAHAHKDSAYNIVYRSVGE